MSARFPILPERSALLRRTRSGYHRGRVTEIRPGRSPVRETFRHNHSIGEAVRIRKEVPPVPASFFPFFPDDCAFCRMDAGGRSRSCDVLMAKNRKEALRKGSASFLFCILLLYPAGRHGSCFPAGPACRPLFPTVYVHPAHLSDIRRAVVRRESEHRRPAALFLHQCFQGYADHLPCRLFVRQSAVFQHGYGSVDQGGQTIAKVLCRRSAPP